MEAQNQGKACKMCRLCLLKDFEAIQGEDKNFQRQRAENKYEEASLLQY